MLPRRVATNPPQAKRKTRIICGPNAGNRFRLKPKALSNSTGRPAFPIAAAFRKSGPYAPASGARRAHRRGCRRIGGFHYRSSIPKRRTASAKRPKHAAVISTQASSVGQNPRRGSSAGKTRNIGNVGTTYQNVYQA